MVPPFPIPAIASAFIKRHCEINVSENFGRVSQAKPAAHNDTAHLAALVALSVSAESCATTN
jgi:hypothetical protein